jgi:hypothetical protein
LLQRSHLHLPTLPIQSAAPEAMPTLKQCLYHRQTTVADDHRRSSPIHTLLEITL